MQDLIYTWTSKELNNYMINKIASLNVICIIYCTYVVHNEQVFFVLIRKVGCVGRVGGGGQKMMLRTSMNVIFISL